MSCEEGIAVIRCHIPELSGATTDEVVAFGIKLGLLSEGADEDDLYDGLE